MITTPAQFTSRSMGSTLPTAFDVASVSSRSTLTVSQLISFFSASRSS